LFAVGSVLFALGPAMDAGPRVPPAARRRRFFVFQPPQDRLVGYGRATCVAARCLRLGLLISPATGQLRNAERSNLGTLIGSVCFLAGALLLLPERTEQVSDPVTHRG
jgi:hypothetical protein